MASMVTLEEKRAALKELQAADALHEAERDTDWDTAPEHHVNRVYEEDAEPILEMFEAMLGKGFGVEA